MAPDHVRDKLKATSVPRGISSRTSLGNLRILEAIGYAAAIIVGLASITNSKALERLETVGLVFSLIVIVRLLVLNASMYVGDKSIGQLADSSQDYAASGAREEETAQ